MNYECDILLLSLYPGDVGGIYSSAIQAALPRLLYAAAPPGPSAQENRRQCLKVSDFDLSLSLLIFGFSSSLSDIGFESLAGKKNPSRICCSPSYTRTRFT